MTSTFYRTVILELDSILADSSDGRALAWTSAFRDGGYDIAFAKVRERIGMGSARVLADLTGLAPDSPVARRIEADARHTFDSDHAPNVTVLPGARDLLARFRREGYVIVLTSSADSDARSMRELLQHAQLTNEFDELLVLPDGARGKPSPDIVLAALERTRTPEAQAIIVGDTPHDLAAARAAGVHSIGLLSGGWPGFALAGSIALYRDPVDLLGNFEMSPLSHSSTFEHAPAPSSTAAAFAF